jgi:hypothetical protein
MENFIRNGMNGEEQGAKQNQPQFFDNFFFWDWGGNKRKICDCNLGHDYTSLLEIRMIFTDNICFCKKRI